MHLVHTRPGLSDVVLFPGTPDSSDLAFRDMQTCRHSGSPLMEKDVGDLQEPYDDLRRICLRAKERRIKLVIDVDWYQPGIDAFGHTDGIIQLISREECLDKVVILWPQFPWASNRTTTLSLCNVSSLSLEMPAHLAHSIALT
ncbi:hypothetical protein BKA82DRAFT_2596018 [Pisolithus tinctorius]|nr:hypothetical protein BKA82DRAFT_2596018 [Pisolithus tinctorius]